MDIKCKKCKYEFSDPYEELDECPNCQFGFIYDEMCTLNYSDCWTYICWEDEY